jgi:mRNA interferase YafQ
MRKLRAVILLLLDDKPLEPRHRDHPLKGDWVGYRDLHVEPDWVLLYRVTEAELMLARTGTHSDLFGEWDHRTSKDRYLKVAAPSGKDQ